MAVAIASMTMLKPGRCLDIANRQCKHNTSQKIVKPSLPFLTLENLTKSFAFSKSSNMGISCEGMAMAMACAVFSSLSCCNAAMAAQQIADIAEGDNRGLLLMAPLIPAILWALFNILDPAINQIRSMRSR